MRRQESKSDSLERFRALEVPNTRQDQIRLHGQKNGPGGKGRTADVAASAFRRQRRNVDACAALGVANVDTSVAANVDAGTALFLAPQR